MDHIDIDEAALSRIRSADRDQPVTMLNLVRFREHALDGFGVDGLSGMQAFERYAMLNATEGVDYAGASGILTFAAGVSSRQITVSVQPDATFEPDETFAAADLPRRERKKPTRQNTRRYSAASADSVTGLPA